MRKQGFFVIIFLFWRTVLPAQDNRILLEGRIGPYPVVMELESFREGAWSGRYFYKSQGKPVELDGSENHSGQLVMNITGDTGKLAETFLLSRSPGRFAGTWSKGEKNLPVSLAAITADQVLHPYKHLASLSTVRKTDPFTYLRTMVLKFRMVKTTREGPCSIGWYEEKRSGLVFPGIISGYPATIMKRINDELLARHLLLALEKLSCTSNPESEWELTHDHLFVTKNIFSLNVISSYYCGGAHPDFSSLPLNFDAGTGRKLSLEEVVQFGRGASSDKQSKAWTTYIDSVFKPKVQNLLLQTYPGEMNRNEVDGCTYEAEYWNEDIWYFTKEGIFIGAYFPRALRSCEAENWSVIPYPLLRNYLTSSFKGRLP